MGIADWFSDFCATIQVKDGGTISTKPTTGSGLALTHPLLYHPAQNNRGQTTVSLWFWPNPAFERDAPKAARPSLLR